MPLLFKYMADLCSNRMVLWSQHEYMIDENFLHWCIFSCHKPKTSQGILLANATGYTVQCNSSHPFEMTYVYAKRRIENNK